MSDDPLGLLPDASPSPLEATSWAALTRVFDPETRISLVDMGLIRAIKDDRQGRLSVVMTLTDATCPLGDFLQESVYLKLIAQPGVDQVHITVELDPPWSPEDISEAGRRQMNGQ